MPVWVLFSLVAMVGNVAKVLVVKRFCQDVDSRLVVLSGRVVSAAVLMPVLVWRFGGVPTDAGFWGTIAVTAVFTAVASVLLTEAVKKGPLAVVMPVQAAVPVFAMGALVVIYHELPGWDAVVLIGVSMAAIAYTLWASYADKRAAGDRRMVFAVYSVIAAGIFGVCTILDRVAISQVADGALAYSACWNLVSAGIMAGETVRARVRVRGMGRKNAAAVGMYAGAVLVAFYAQQYAVQRSLEIAGAVVNVKSVVMLHLPVVILAGVLFFGERVSRRVLVGGLVAVAAGIWLVRVIV
ncbi:phosphonate utilization associated putative membrane protein [Anaerohalosphaera lusitana]|uniref:Phosphonate utilization associated putative membrane protein n=1 Tax=Anaerohalosphaera lusitana TaxID=1936003 RepID=A0A1U9NL31_9BACT|nr:DMT family transporter [Anaerohalosphaera lusitana]AQT68438.1 phosphonate utilization associated putative membrane protein [Anaerohalosphaera lusitana]